MMAVETFVNIYIFAFGVAVAIGAGLLLAAARNLSKHGPDDDFD